MDNAMDNTMIRSTDNHVKRMRYTRQSIVTNTFYQMPRFLTAGEFAGNAISNNARILYTLLSDRHRVSVKNGWFDENGEVYIYFKREEMEAQLGLSDKTVVKAMQELKNHTLVEEKQQGLNRPNKIYLLSPIIGNDENPSGYIDPETDYNPEIEPDYSYPAEHSITPAPDKEHLRPRTRSNSDSGIVKTSVPGHGDIPLQGTEDLRPKYNKLNNNKINNNEMSENEGRKTATADSSDGAANQSNNNGGVAPYKQILEMFNSLCETTGLRTIRNIDGKRKTATAARFKEYGPSGFFDLFERVASSSFLCGGGDRGWKADYDWLITPDNMQKVLEGKYDNDQFFPNKASPCATTASANGAVVDKPLNYSYAAYSNKKGVNTMGILQEMLAEEMLAGEESTENTQNDNTQRQIYGEVVNT